MEMKGKRFVISCFKMKLWTFFNINWKYLWDYKKNVFLKMYSAYRCPMQKLLCGFTLSIFEITNVISMKQSYNINKLSSVVY
jgi:hypothetical protein